MKVQSEAVLLRIHIGEADKFEGKPLYKKILSVLRENKIAGATVIRGIAGFGKSTVLHTASIIDISEDLPIVIEVIDREENINTVLPKIDELIKDGLITMEKVKVIKYSSSKDKT
ncbi:MAG: DUF190 domain-containing protein [Hydrogenothermaceae bacterium]|nr:DUF190 domain-containing protein [Hydrogenothermaceae bacterium]